MSTNTQQSNIKKSSSMAFSFGDPEPVLSSNPMDYLGGIQSVLLSEESVLFRRKYFSNGALNYEKIAPRKKTSASFSD